MVVTVGSLVRSRLPGAVITAVPSTSLQSVLEGLSGRSVEIAVLVLRARVPSLGLTETISLTSWPLVVGRLVKCRGRRQRVGLVIVRVTRPMVRCNLRRGLVQHFIGMRIRPMRAGVRICKSELIGCQRSGRGCGIDKRHERRWRRPINHVPVYGDPPYQCSIILVPVQYHFIA